jgi:imidazolonepropionase-like amidohydrolase
MSLAAAWLSTLQAQDTTRSPRRTLARYEQEVRFADLMLATEQRYRAADATVRHVNVVDVEAGRVMSNVRVDVRRGRIAAMAVDTSAGVRTGEIDGSGRFLAPGLTDMHVHQFVSASEHLLHVATGVTTVRDMNGFAATLRWREQARNDRWLVPNMIVVGRFLNAEPMGMYATVVRSPDEARAAVRAQTDSGYDFIKTYSQLPVATYDAILDEAHRLGIGVVGHVPGGVSIAHAVASGQQTLEHFTGYIDANSYEVASNDWVDATQFGASWVVPTLYTNDRFARRGSSAQQWFTSDEARYVPALTLEVWRREAAEPPPPWLADKNARERRVLDRLLQTTRRILAGTDVGGGYAFMVAGFALIEELRLLHEAGLSNVEVLRAATVQAAEATGRQQEYGAVRVGLRADLLLLDGNPMEDLSVLRRPSGVMLRGRWLDRHALDEILGEVARISADTPAIATRSDALTEVWANQFATRVAEHVRSGYLFPAHHLRAMATALRLAGHPRAGERIRALLGR